MHAKRNLEQFRAIDVDGNFRVVARGRKRHPLKDVFHFFLNISWWQFLLIVAGGYAAINLFFTGLYLLDSNGIRNARPRSFADAFFFSIQTLSTIGYGNFSPNSFYSHIVVSIEAFTGILGTALMTGMVFAKFSRPSARVLFTDVACIAKRDGLPVFMVRIGNERSTEIIDASVKVIMVEDAITSEGEPIRRFHNLRVVRPETAMFALSWTIVHPIDECSPLHGMTKETLEDCSAEIIVIVSGMDNATAQQVNSRRSYIANEILWNHRFADILDRTEDGVIVADYGRFFDVVPSEQPL